MKTNCGADFVYEKQQSLNHADVLSKNIESISDRNIFKQLPNSKTDFGTNKNPPSLLNAYMASFST